MVEYDKHFAEESGSCTIKYHDGTTEAETLKECSAIPVLKAGGIKAAEVLTEFTVQLHMESKIRLPGTALEIKKIDKNVVLTEGKLINNTGRIFLKGFVRKNIEYASVDTVTKTAICGDIRYLTLETSFLCTTEVDDIMGMEINENTQLEEILHTGKENDGAEFKEKDYQTEEFFNEKIYCELVSSRIYEAGIAEEFQPIEFHPKKSGFRDFTEREIMLITVRLLRYRQLDDLKQQGIQGGSHIE